MKLILYSTPVREPIDNLTPEERDARTVFCMQLAARIRPRDLEEFSSRVGKVRDVRMISDRNSRRSKGIAYVEFVDVSSVPLTIQFSSIQSLSRVQLCDPMNYSTPGLQSITNHGNPPKPMSTESVMPTSHLILCHPLLLLPSIFPNIRLFSNESALRIRWPK